jgi:hypothetical protein
MAISVSIKLQPMMPQHLHIELQISMTSDISRPLLQVLTQIMGISYVVKPTGAHHPNSGSQVTDLMLRVAIL